MRIGIIGVGVVGGTLKYGFTRLGHDVIEHDIDLFTEIEDLRGTDLVFICVPTPQAEDGSCDTSIVNEVVTELLMIRYQGLIVIKSTVPPGTTDYLSQLGLRLAYCPEFLREKATYSDFVENHEVCIIGAYDARDYHLIHEAHGHFPKSFERLKPIEAEIAKYFANTFNATRIIFANQFFNVCEHAGADYQKVKNAIAKRGSIGNYYLDCNKNFRAFGGSCIPKDTAAMAAYVNDRKIDAGLFAWLLAENEKLRGA